MRNFDKARSGCKTWDRQVGVLTTGNIISTGFAGRYVRSFRDVNTAFGGGNYEPGYLQGFDLNNFDYFWKSAKWVRGEVIKSLTPIDGGGILYVFWHTNPNRKDTVHGFTLTDREHKLIKEWVTGPTQKSYAVIQFARPYISTWSPLPAAEQLGLKVK